MCHIIPFKIFTQISQVITKNKGIKKLPPLGLYLRTSGLTNINSPQDFFVPIEFSLNGEYSVDSTESRENKRNPVAKYYLQWGWKPGTSVIPALARVNRA